MVVTFHNRPCRCRTYLCLYYACVLPLGGQAGTRKGVGVGGRGRVITMVLQQHSCECRGREILIQIIIVVFKVNVRQPHWVALR